MRQRATRLLAVRLGAFIDSVRSLEGISFYWSTLKKRANCSSHALISPASSPRVDQLLYVVRDRHDHGLLQKLKRRDADVLERDKFEAPELLEQCVDDRLAPPAQLGILCLVPAQASRARGMISRPTSMSSDARPDRRTSLRSARPRTSPECFLRLASFDQPCNRDPSRPPMIRNAPAMTGMPHHGTPYPPPISSTRIGVGLGVGGPTAI